MLNKTEIKKLSKFESNFNTAVYHNYSRAILSKDIDEMESIYMKHNEGANKINRGCSRCVLSFLQDLGKLYFKSKEEKGL